jgi:hypothetical protein
MRRIGFLGYHFGSGLRLNYNGDRFLIEKGDFTQLDNCRGKIKIEDTNCEGIYTCFNLIIARNHGTTYLNGLRLDDLIEEMTRED